MAGGYKRACRLLGPRHRMLLTTQGFGSESAQPLLCGDENALTG